jgi:glycosyltransferase involved in cell wall biosynthesis/exonuclease VII small subunit
MIEAPYLAALSEQGKRSFQEWLCFPEASGIEQEVTTDPHQPNGLCLFHWANSNAEQSTEETRSFIRAMADCRFAVGIASDKASALKLEETLRSASIPFLPGISSLRQTFLEKDTNVVICGRHAHPNPGFSRRLRVAAIMLVYNELDILPSAITNLSAQGIEVHVIDDYSDDGSYESAESLLREGKLTSLRRSGVDSCEPARWQALLHEVEKVASNLNVDWILHHDADEIRTSPWPNISLKQGIEFVDSLGYNAIDFTVINFLFTSCEPPITNTSAVDELRFFEFPTHEANFHQVKAWRKEAEMINLTNSGGHDVAFRSRRVYPLKFLNRHYPLRSATQAASKLFKQRKIRFRHEREEKGWHVHYDPFQLIECIEPWDKRELLYYQADVFNRHYLIERLSGCSLEHSEVVHLNRQTATRVLKRYCGLRKSLIEWHLEYCLTQNDSSDPPPDETILQSLMEHARDLESEIDRLDASLKAAQMANNELDEERGLLLDAKRGLEKANAELHAANTDLYQANNLLMMRLHAVYSSFSWRLAGVYRKPANIIKSLLKYR